MGWGQIRRQIVYKAAMRGAVVDIAVRCYPSSKTCSDCGEVCRSLPLSVRRWTCSACGSEHGRDGNAAINLRNLAVRSTMSACGEDGADHKRLLAAKPASMKQEVNCESVQADSSRYDRTGIQVKGRLSRPSPSANADNSKQIRC